MDGHGTRNLSWWLLASGIALLCAADVRFLFAAAADTYAEGGLLDITWPLSAVLMGLAACTTQGHGPTEVAAKARFLFPSAFCVTSVGLLVYGQGRTLPVAAVALAVASLGAAAARVFLTVREVAALASSRREARTDDLTGLANRRRLLEYLTLQVTDPGAVTSLLVLDLDRFKEVNDSLGHGAGDGLLHDVSRRLAPVVPAPALLARLGGDEFAAVLPGTSLDQALRIAERLGECLERPFAVAGTVFPVEASLGVASAPRSLQVLLRLREVGVGVSVDDYGTGHSSLSYLRDLPISELKPDRSFLQAVPVDTHNAAIVRSTVQLAHALGLPIVAEDAEALGWLRDIDCDIGQGFHLCRPLPMDELRSWLPSHAAPGTGARPSAAAGQRSMSA